MKSNNHPPYRDWGVYPSKHVHTILLPAHNLSYHNPVKHLRETFMSIWIFISVGMLDRVGVMYEVRTLHNVNARLMSRYDVGVIGS